MSDLYSCKVFGSHVILESFSIFSPSLRDAPSKNKENKATKMNSVCDYYEV